MSPTSLASQRGMSLIELMIALVLSSLLLWGVLQIFDSNRNTMRMQTAFARVQESGRFSMDLLAREIRMADYWGCVPDPGSIENHLDQVGDAADYAAASGYVASLGSQGILGTDNASSQTVGTKAVVDGTDILILRGADDACRGTGRMMPSQTAASLHVSQNCDVQPKEIVLLTNCQSGELFTVTNVQAGNGGDSDKRTITHTQGNQGEGYVDNLSKNLQREYGADSRLLRPYQRRFFIANSATGSPSLFVSENGANAQELIPGVEDMQILYGRDTGGDRVVDTWSSAEGLTDDDMEQALALKVQVVVASDISVNADDLTVTDLDNIDTTYTDGKLRKVYLSTAKVRNRGGM